MGSDGPIKLVVKSREDEEGPRDFFQTDLGLSESRESPIPEPGIMLGIGVGEGP